MQKDQFSSRAYATKSSRAIYHQDNARPHTARVFNNVYNVIMCIYGLTGHHILLQYRKFRTCSKADLVVSEDYQSILVDDILRQKDTGNFCTAEAYFNG